MGASSSSNSQSTYIKQSNTVSINATTDFLNQSVLNSIKKALIYSQNSCSQSFKSTDLLQISNINAIGDVNISNLSIDAKSVVVLDCIIATQILSQAEDNFLTDNQAGIASVLQSVGNSDFFNNVSGTLKSAIDSIPGINISNSSNNQNITIDNTTATNVAQTLKNLYQSSNTNETDVSNVSSVIQDFKSQQTLVVNNISTGGNVNINVLKIDSIQNFSSTAKLTTAITNVIIQKLQNILGMKVSFDGSTQSSNSSSIDQTLQTNNSISSNAFFSSVNKAIDAASSVLNTPKTITIVIGVVVAVVGVGVVIGIVMLFKSLFSSPIALDTLSQIAQKGLEKIPSKGGFGMTKEDVYKFDEIIKNSFNIVQEDTMNLLKNTLEL